jgi:hypothetical protein
LSKLTQEQIKFLRQHNISLGAVFDATGLGPKAYGAEMRALGKAVAFGVTRCKKGGHSLRSRSGSCVVCEPAFLAFQSRYEDFAYVYIAGSKKLKLIKAGFASDVSARMSSLNSLGYAGTLDWENLFWAKTENAGRVEFNLHSELSAYKKPTNYQRDGNTVDCLETFSCSASTAIEILKSLAETGSTFWINKNKIGQFEFLTIKSEMLKRKGNCKGVGGAVPLNSPGVSKDRPQDPKPTDYRDKPEINEIKLLIDAAEMMNHGNTDGMSKLLTIANGKRSKRLKVIEKDKTHFAIPLRNILHAAGLEAGEGGNYRFDKTRDFGVAWDVNKGLDFDVEVINVLKRLSTSFVISNEFKKAFPDPINSKAKGPIGELKKIMPDRTKLIEGDLIQSFPNAGLLIDYSDAVETAWRAVQVLPSDCEKQFLSKLDANPNLHPDILALEIFNDFLEMRPNMETEVSNEAAKFARNISLEAEDEFAKVYSLSNPTLSIEAIIKKLSLKFGESNSIREQAFNYFQKCKNTYETTGKKPDLIKPKPIGVRKSKDEAYDLTSLLGEEKVNQMKSSAKLKEIFKLGVARLTMFGTLTELTKAFETIGIKLFLNQKTLQPNKAANGREYTLENPKTRTTLLLRGPGRLIKSVESIFENF